VDRAAAPPTWLEELLELLEIRRRLAIAVAGAVVVTGLLVAFLAPGVLPATPGVGAAVGVAACLLALAAVIGLDAGDLSVQGARHVRAAGADVAVVLRGRAEGGGVNAVVQRLDALGAHRVALVPAAAGARDATVAIADGLGQAWARAERRVLVVDASRPDASQAGIVDVARGEAPLGEAVTFDPRLMLARLGAGADLETALVELPGLAPRLPADIERTVVALPPLTDPAARAGATAVECVLVLAVVGSTSRVDLLATLEALDLVAVHAQVLLHRPGDVSPAATPPHAPVPAPASDDGGRARPGVPDHPHDDPADPADPADPDDLDDLDGLDGLDHSDGLDETGPLPFDAVRPDESGERGPRPVMAARERTEVWADDDPDGTSARSPAALLDQDEQEQEQEPEPARPPRTAALLGLAEIDREIEQEAAAAAAPPRPDLRVDAGAGPLRAVPRHDLVDTPDDREVTDDEDAAAEDLVATAVLETLAQEIWSREHLGGTA